MSHYSAVAQPPASLHNVEPFRPRNPSGTKKSSMAVPMRFVGAVSGDYGKIQRSGERFSTGSRQQAEERDAHDADQYTAHRGATTTGMIPRLMQPQSALPGQVVTVCTYTDLDILAHQPKGTPSDHGLHVFRFEANTGRLTLMSVVKDILNPAFIRYHPTKKVMYVLTETVKENSKVHTYALSANTAEIYPLGEPVDCGGKSTCYATISGDASKMLLVSYWDSSLTTVPLHPESGQCLPVMQATKTPTRTKKKAPSQHGEDPHGKHRSDETHAHALALDPFLKRVAYVPDLGEDSLKQLAFDPATGRLTPTGDIFTGDPKTGPHGPRYMEFHPVFNVAYVINELASTVAVFEFNETLARASIDNPKGNIQTLTHVQTISTIPKGYPKSLNTCGRIAVSPSGNWVLGSNRGHDSIAVFSVQRDTYNCQSGHLLLAGYYHTRGRTPRHFKFDATGRWILTANQDSDTISVFAFDENSGSMTLAYTYNCPSPNFIGCARPAPERYDGAVEDSISQKMPVIVPRNRESSTHTEYNNESKL